MCWARRTEDDLLIVLGLSNFGVAPILLNMMSCLACIY